MILLNDVPIEDYGLFAEKGHSHPTPSFNNKTVKIPGRPGEYHFGSEISSRPHGIPLGVLEPTRLDTQHKLRSFLEVILDEYGKPKPIEMRYDYEPDKYYTVYVEDAINPMFEHEYANANMRLVAYDPVAYSIAYGDEVYWGSEEITFESHYLLGHDGIVGEQHITSPTTFNVVSNGYAVQPIIEINGSANDLAISTNGKSFSLPNFSNSEYVLDPSHYLTEKNGANAFGDKTGDWLTLLPGDNDVQVTGTNLDIHVRIKFRDRYM